MPFLSIGYTFWGETSQSPQPSSSSLAFTGFLSGINLGTLFGGSILAVYFGFDSSFTIGFISGFLADDFAVAAGGAHLSFYVFYAAGFFCS